MVGSLGPEGTVSDNMIGSRQHWDFFSNVSTGPLFVRRI